MLIEISARLPHFFKQVLLQQGVGDAGLDFPDKAVIQEPDARITDGERREMAHAATNHVVDRVERSGAVNEYAILIMQQPYCRFRRSELRRVIRDAYLDSSTEKRGSGDFVIDRRPPERESGGKRVWIRIRSCH